MGEPRRSGAMDEHADQDNRTSEGEEAELVSRLDQMNVEPPMAPYYQGGRVLEGRQGAANNEEEEEEDEDEDDDEEEEMSVDVDETEEAGGVWAPSGRLEREPPGNILIVTNLDPAVFTDRLMKAKLESLFAAHDEHLVVRYLKSFRRVRLDFSSGARAESARRQLNNYKLGATSFKCFLAQIIRPNYDRSARDSQGERVRRRHGPETDDEDEEEEEVDEFGRPADDESGLPRYYGGSQRRPNQQQQQRQRQSYVKKGYLNIPKLTRQYLISPPMSPPENWRPKEESEPCIDVQLLAAIANLVPGQTHELHAGNDSQPGIVVEVCEEPYFDTTSKLSCKHRLPKSSIPATPRPERADSVEDDDDEMQP